jgi:WD40 repeat protein/uncharacterized caspase-like protein
MSTKPRVSGLFAVGLCLLATSAFAQGSSPSPSPNSQDKRGLGVQSSSSTNNSQANSQSREAKPELVLQTGYSNFFGATRLVFSPDGRLLATTTFRSSSIKLWETATGRELRNLSGGGQSGFTLSPYVAFSRDSRLVAGSAGNNAVKIWDVATGKEIQTLSVAQGGIATAMTGVYFIAFDQNGRVVTISDAIRLWDANTGQELRSLKLTSMNAAVAMGGEGGAALTPDGSQLAFVSFDGSKQQVKFWDLNNGREVRSIDVDVKNAQNTQLSFAPDGHLIVAAIEDQRLKLWDFNPKAKERDFGSTKGKWDLAQFSSDGRLLSLVEGYKIRIWDLSSGRELSGLEAPSSGLFGEQGRAFTGFSTDGKRLASGGFVTPTIVWDIESGKQLIQMTGRTNMAYKVAFSADGTRLSSGGRTRWDLRTGRGLRVSPAARDNVYPVPSLDGRFIAAFTPNSTAVTVMELPSGRTIQTLSPGTAPGSVQRVSFSPDGTRLVTSYSADPQTAFGSPAAAVENQVKIWDVKSGRELHSLNVGGGSLEANFSADGRFLATLGTRGEVSLWEVESGKQLTSFSTSPVPNFGGLGKAGSIGAIDPKTLRGMKAGSTPAMPNLADLSAMMTNVLGGIAAGTMGRNVTSISFSPDGKIVATGGVESKSNIDFAGMMSAQQKPKNRKTPDYNDFMRDMKVEVTGQVVLWDAASGREIGALKGHGKGVTQVAFSRDGRLLASASTDNTIRIWDVVTRSEVRTLVGHTANVESIDFSPDGRLLASASDDGGTFLWDVASGDHLLTLISLDDGGEWMVVTPQGLFDGTPASWNQILWRYQQDTFNVAPIEWFFNEFYYPGLLSDVFAGKRPKVSLDVSKKDRRQPIVKLSAPGGASGIANRTIKVKIDVVDPTADKNHSQSSGALDVRLFRNGSLVKVWHGDVLNGKREISLEQDVTITAGSNQLTAYAFNKDNVKSKDAQLDLTGADSLKRSGTAYVIAVGVNQYANSQYNLKYAVADAQSFGEEVRRRLPEATRVEQLEVVSLLNENATKANILAALRRLAGSGGSDAAEPAGLAALKRAQPEDTVIIYYAGHGTAQAQRFYLIPHDLGYTGERTRLDEQGLQTILSHSISDVELQQAVEDLDAGHLLLIIDACNSGQALEAEEKRRGPMNSKGLAQLAYEKGMYILTAAQSYQAALEASQLGHGLLTYALVEEGLKTAIADNEPKDGLLSAREWLDFATERVPLMQEEKMRQGRDLGLQIAFTEGEQKIAEPEKRSVQRPRVFYRRELERNQLVVAKP